MASELAAAAGGPVPVVVGGGRPGDVRHVVADPARAGALLGFRAADIAAAALLDTLAAVGAVPGGCPVVALSGSLGAAARADDLTAVLHGLRVLPQRGTGLGGRIAAAHDDTAGLLPGLPALLVGMDTPQVTPDLFGEAAAPLGRNADAVLGPAADGGWWALGPRDPRQAALVRDVPTSRPDTGERTLRALREAGLRVALLPDLRDVDTPDDAFAVAAALPGSRFAAAVTAALPAAHPAVPC